MNLNLIGYGIYTLITAVIIIRVGAICYHNGNIFVANLVPNDKEFCVRVNKLLLIGYYLFNLGYAVISFSKWPIINTVTHMTEVICYQSAIIICLLAGLHYFNIFWISKFIKTFKTTI